MDLELWCEQIGSWFFPTVHLAKVGEGDRNEPEDVIVEAETGVMWGQEPKNYGIQQLLEAKKVKKMILL